MVVAFLLHQHNSVGFDGFPVHCADSEIPTLFVGCTPRSPILKNRSSTPSVIEMMIPVPVNRTVANPARAKVHIGFAWHNYRTSRRVSSNYFFQAHNFQQQAKIMRRPQNKNSEARQALGESRGNLGSCIVGTRV